MKEYIDAEQAAERLKDGYAEYFQKYDVLLTPVLQAQPGGVADRRPDWGCYGHRVRDIVLSVTGLPGVSMRFATSREGTPIGIQIVGSWQTESTILHFATLL